MLLGIRETHDRKFAVVDMSDREHDSPVVGEFASREEAEAYREELRASEIPVEKPAPTIIEDEDGEPENMPIDIPPYVFVNDDPSMTGVPTSETVTTANNIAIEDNGSAANETVMAEIVAGLPENQPDPEPEPKPKKPKSGKKGK